MMRFEKSCLVPVVAWLVAGGCGSCVEHAEGPGDVGATDGATDGAGLDLVGRDLSAQDHAVAAEVPPFDGGSGACQLILGDSSLALGTVVVGSTASATMVALNSGTGNCRLLGVSVTPVLSTLAVVEPTRYPVDLVPHATVAIGVAFTPMAAGSLSAELALDVLGQASAVTFSVAATAVAAPPSCVRMSRALLDFGQVASGCVERRTFALINDCDSSQQVNALTHLGHPDFELTTAAPLALTAGQWLPVEVRFTATASAEVATGRVTAGLSDGTAVTGSVELVASTVSSATLSEQFVQGGNRPLDLLLIVDDSGSMTPIQQQLATDLVALIDELALLGVDYRIGVTTTTTDGDPAGQLMPLSESEPVISPSSLPDPTDRLVSAVNVGNYGSSYEMGLDAARLALSPALLAGRNSGLVRSDALLAVLFVSDEDDASTSSPEQLLELLRGIKAPLGDNGLSVGAVVGPAPAGCTTASGEPAAGLRYLDLVQRAAGVSASVCDASWTALLRQLIRLGAGQRTTFFLGNPPTAAPAVSVAGVVRTLNTDFLYDAADRSITFSHAALPTPGQIILVSYPVGCGG